MHSKRSTCQDPGSDSCSGSGSGSGSGANPRSCRYVHPSVHASTVLLLPVTSTGNGIQQKRCLGSQASVNGCTTNMVALSCRGGILGPVYPEHDAAAVERLRSQVWRHPLAPVTEFRCGTWDIAFGAHVAHGIISWCVPRGCACYKAHTTWALCITLTLTQTSLTMLGVVVPMHGMSHRVVEGCPTDLHLLPN
jgi:hypothetical protein